MRQVAQIAAQHLLVIHSFTTITRLVCARD